MQFALFGQYRLRAISSQAILRARFRTSRGSRKRL
jgi:hypothetical protein